MSLQIPSYPDPQSTTPIADAYAWIAFLSLDLRIGYGQIVLDVQRDADAAATTPPLPAADQLTIHLGDSLGSNGRFPTLAEAMADPDFAAAWGVIRAKLYEWAKRHPLLANATDVP